MRDSARPDVVSCGHAKKTCSDLDPTQEARPAVDPVSPVSRSSHPPPRAVWQAAISLARHEGLYRTARTLQLNYASLKKRLEMSSQGSGRSGRKLSHYFKPKLNHLSA